jgi:hypothetical protein
MLQELIEHRGLTNDKLSKIGGRVPGADDQ